MEASDLTFCTATFESEDWAELANHRVRPSIEAEGFPWVHVHADSLASARNACLDRVETEWVATIDADDEIEAGYAAAMLAGQGDVRAPSVRRVKADGRAKRRTYMPRVWNHTHECRGDCLPLGNWVTVGAMARTDLLREVGGWGDEAIYEDFALWLRCWKAGGDIQPCPDAVYRYWESPNHRNGSLPPAERDEWHHRIVESVMGVAA